MGQSRERRVKSGRQNRDNKKWRCGDRIPTNLDLFSDVIVDNRAIFSPDVFSDGANGCMAEFRLPQKMLNVHLVRVIFIYGRLDLIWWD